MDNTNYNTKTSKLAKINLNVQNYHISSFTNSSKTRFVGFYFIQSCNNTFLKKSPNRFSIFIVHKIDIL
jgi:hypothetical protein